MSGMIVDGRNITFYFEEKEITKMDLKDYLDPTGLVKPSKGISTSGNGLLYTSVYVLLDNLTLGHLEGAWNYTTVIDQCMLKPGLLTRVPDNSQKQESWDDYLGVAAACIKLNVRSIPRAILWYALRHAFFMNTDGKLSMDDFLGRFPQVWSLMWVAAFPWLKWPMYPILGLIQMTYKFDLSSPGEWQLQWVFLEACKYLGFHFDNYEYAIASLPSVFERYYETGHPFIEAARIKLQSELA